MNWLKSLLLGGVKSALLAGVNDLDLLKPQLVALLAPKLQDSTQAGPLVDSAIGIIKTELANVINKNIAG